MLYFCGVTQSFFHEIDYNSMIHDYNHICPFLPYKKKKNSSPQIQYLSIYSVFSIIFHWLPFKAAEKYRKGSITAIILKKTKFVEPFSPKKKVHYFFFAPSSQQSKILYTYNRKGEWAIHCLYPLIVSAPTTIKKEKKID